MPGSPGPLSSHSLCRHNHRFAWRSLEKWNSVVYIKVLVAKNLLQNINVVPAAENYSKTWRFISGSIFSFLFRSERPLLKKNTCTVYSLYNVQGCALQKIEGNPVLWTCKIQCAQHMISMKKLRFSSHPRTKVRHHGPLGSARAQPWLYIHFILV